MGQPLFNFLSKVTIFLYTVQSIRITTVFPIFQWMMIGLFIFDGGDYGSTKSRQIKIFPNRKIEIKTTR